MKYPLDPQFELLSYFKVPAEKSKMEAVQKIFRMIPVRSDKYTNVTKTSITARDGEKIPVFIFEPKGKGGQTLPCLFYCHGGGFMHVALPYLFSTVKAYSNIAECRVIFPDYRLTPKYPYPGAINDCFDTYRWMLDNCNELKIDTSRIIVGGDSAGGDLSAALTFMIRDEQITAPVFQMLIYPVTDRRMRTESTKRFPDTPVWNSELSKIMWAWYLPEIPADHIEYASPNEAESFDGIPDAYVEVEEFDSLRDEGIEYAEKLKEHGINVTLKEISGTPHAFEMASNASFTKDQIAYRARLLYKKFYE